MDAGNTWCLANLCVCLLNNWLIVGACIAGIDCIVGSVIVNPVTVTVCCAAAVDAAGWKMPGTRSQVGPFDK